MLGNQSCDTVSQAITTLFSRLQPPAANSICDSTVAAASWFLWHANVTAKQIIIIKKNTLICSIIPKRRTKFKSFQCSNTSQILSMINFVVILNLMPFVTVFAPSTESYISKTNSP